MAKKQFTKFLFETPSVANGEEAEMKKDDFLFEKRLGDGAFGKVWRVRHLSTQKLYAVKEVPKDKVMKMLPQFKREVFIMYQLSHPHIIKLHSHFEDETSFYLIMELSEGGNMFHKLYREKQFYEQLAAQYFREVVLAVEYLHSHVPAIIHRDIKPENILLDSDGRLKLTDFGWSNYYNVDQPIPRTTVCGTLEYLPPEIVEQKGHGTGADIWCLGVLLFEMLVGYTPFKSNAKERMLSNISKIKPKFPMSFPPVAKDLVTRMLQKNPQERMTIQQVKAHRWLVETPPMRPTLSQSLCEIVIPPLNTGDQAVTTGYTVISTPEQKRLSTSDTKPEDQQADDDGELRGSDKQDKKKVPGSPLLESAIKHSISQVESAVLVTKEERKYYEAMLFSTQTRFDQRAKNLEDLQSLIQGLSIARETQRKTEAKLLTQIADKNVELERLQTTHNHVKLSQEILAAKSTLGSKSAEANLTMAQLLRLREEDSEKARDIACKEKEVKLLEEKLQAVKGDMNSQKRGHQSRITELNMSAALLQCRIDGQSRFSRELDPNDQLLIEEMHELSKTKVDLLVYKHSQSENLSQKIEEVQEQMVDREQDLSKLIGGYEVMRSEIPQERRRLKDEVQMKARSLRDDQLHSRQKLSDTEKLHLRSTLSEAREAESLLSTTLTEIDRVKTAYKVPATQQSAEKQDRIRLQIDNLRAIHLELKEQIAQNARKIEERENELATVKCAVLNPIMDN